MIEFFRQWAPDEDVANVAKLKTKWQQEKVKNINNVASVADAASKIQQPEKNLPNPNLLENFLDCINKAATPATLTTSPKTQNNSCCQTLNPSGNTGNKSTLTMAESMVTEGMTWPPETQRVWGAVRQWFEVKGYEIDQASAIAFVVVKELILQHGGPLVLINELSNSIRDTVAFAQELFKGVQVEWRSSQKEKQIEVQKNDDNRPDLVCCAMCNYFIPNQVGDAANGLGICGDQPWNGFKAQWPNKPNHCSNYKCSIH